MMSSTSGQRTGPGFGTYIGIAVVGIVLAITIGILSRDFIWAGGLLVLSVAMAVYAFVARRPHRRISQGKAKESDSP
mgnify:FL=1